MDHMNSRDVHSKSVPGVGLGGVDRVGHGGVGWGRSCRDGWVGRVM